MVMSYLPASLVVVQVHKSPTGGLAFTPLPHIHKGLRKGHSIRNVITAARPLEPYDKIYRERQDMVTCMALLSPFKHQLNTTFECPFQYSCIDGSLS